MNVIKAETLGYCMGVRRAIESAERALEEYRGKKVCSLGPLIHNRSALDDLEKKGLHILDESRADTAGSDCVVIIRAHGISPALKSRLVRQNAVLIDSTCPRVTVSQKRAAEFSKKGCPVILAGDRGHAEVEGIKGYAESGFYCIENLLEAQNTFPERMDLHALLLCQTTFSPGEFDKITDYLKSKISHLEVINTICPATKKRQDALFKLSERVDGVVVVGGKKSANTVRLFQKASSLVPHAVHIERASEIPLFFKNLETVGVTAGASTPDSVIDEVVSALRSM